MRSRNLTNDTNSPAVARVMDRHHGGSDVDLCLVVPSFELEDLLLLGARLDDLLLPCSFDLQLKHRIDHPGLLEYIELIRLRECAAVSCEATLRTSGGNRGRSGCGF